MDHETRLFYQPILPFSTKYAFIESLIIKENVAEDNMTNKVCVNGIGVRFKIPKVARIVAATMVIITAIKRNWLGLDLQK